MPPEPLHRAVRDAHIRAMKLLFAPLLVVAALSAPAASAQEDDSLSEGMRRLSEGSRIILERIMGDLAPMMAELRSMINDFSRYEMPEVLPNGDIIIRRKPEDPAPDHDPGTPKAPPPSGPIDL